MAISNFHDTKSPKEGIINFDFSYFTIIAYHGGLFFGLRDINLFIADLQRHDTHGY